MKLQTLRPIDVFILLKLSTLHAKISQNELSRELQISVSTVHESLRRSADCHLYNQRLGLVVIAGLEEFLQYGIRYVFPVVRGPMTRGIPTSHSGPVLRNLLTAPTQWPPVWPSPLGSERGYAVAPLHHGALVSPQRDDRFYELLTLVDALREARGRESEVAWAETRRRLNEYSLG